MATNDSNRLENLYENSIGSPSTAEDAYGYWMYVLGIVAGFVGIALVMVSNNPGDAIRGGGIALAALGLILLLIGPSIRLPLKTTAKMLSFIGAVVATLAVAWFVVAFNAGNWGAAFANSEPLVIGLYGLGVFIVATGSVFTPLLTQPQKEQQAAEARAGEAEAKRDAAMNKVEQQKATENDEQRAAEARAGEAEAKRDAAMSEIRRQNGEDSEETAATSEAEHQALVTELRRLKESQSQFELYTDQGGKYRWRLRHDNDNIIADSSQGYASRQGAQRGLSAVKRDVFGAAVLDLDKVEADAADDSQPADDDAGADPTVAGDQNGTQATFETYEDSGGDHRWRLRHDNDNIIADSSQGYASEASRDNGLESVRHYVQAADYLHIDPAAFELYRDQGGEYRWRLLHENGNILAESGQGYASRQGARQGVDSVQETVAADGNAEFEVYEDSAGEYRFRLVHDNGNIIADGGQAYDSESSAHDAVARIREYAPEAHALAIGSATIEIYEDDGGDWRWRLRHRNGNIMADGSQGYASRTNAEDGLTSVKQNAPDADVESVSS